MLSRVPSSGPKEVSRAVEAARAAFREGSAMTGMERGRTLCRAAEKVRIHRVWFIWATVNILIPSHKCTNCTAIGILRRLEVMGSLKVLKWNKMVVSNITTKYYSSRVLLSLDVMCI